MANSEDLIMAATELTVAWANNLKTTTGPDEVLNAYKTIYAGLIKIEAEHNPDITPKSDRSMGV